MKSGKLFAILILLIAANITIFPQIKIKEKVEIKPTPQNMLLKTFAESADLRIEFIGEGGHYGITLGGVTYSAAAEALLKYQLFPAELILRRAGVLKMIKLIAIKLCGVITVLL